MDTKTLVEKARTLHREAIEKLAAEIAETQTHLNELKEAQKSLTFRSIVADTAQGMKSAVTNATRSVASQARKTMKQSGGPSTTRPLANKSAVKAAARPASATASNKDKLLEKLPDHFTMDDLRQRGGAPITLAHWSRAGKIKKLVNGSYKKLAAAKTASTKSTASTTTATSASRGAKTSIKAAV